MRSRPNRRIKTGWMWGWRYAVLTAAILGLCGAALAAGQSPASQQTAPTAEAPAQATPTAAQPAQATTTPSQADAKAAQRGAVPGGAGANAAPGAAQPTQAPAQPTAATVQPATGAKPVPEVQQLGAAQAATAGGGDVQTQQIEQETADLLKMATDLQAEVNKTKVATLSLDVVRKASAIEQMAKKMRSQP